MSSSSKNLRRNFVPVADSPAGVYKSCLHNLLQHIKRSREVSQDLIEQAHLLKERIGELPPKIAPLWNKLYYWGPLQRRQR